MPRKYEKVQELLPEVKRLREIGYTHRQIAEKFGLSDRRVIKELLKRERRKAAQDAAIAIEPPVQGNPEPETDIPPDPAISVEARNAYGYTDDAMLPLTKERAMELFERDVPVYLLYGDTSSTTVQRNSRRSSQRRPIYRRCLKPQNRLFRKISRILNRVKSLPFWQCSTHPRRPEAKRPRRQKSAERDLI